MKLGAVYGLYAAHLQNEGHPENLHVPRSRAQVHQLRGAWTAPYSRERFGKLQIPQTLRNKLSVPGHAGKYFPAFHFRSGAVLLAAFVGTTFDDSDCVWYLL